MGVRRNSQDERLRRAQRAVGAAGAAPTPDQLAQLATQAARAGRRSDWALAALLAWPRHKRAGWKAPGQLTIDEAVRVVRGALLGLGWLPKEYSMSPCPNTAAHERAEEVRRELGELPPHRTRVLPISEDMRIEADMQAHPERYPAVALMRRRPELREWLERERCSTCKGTGQIIGLGSVMPPGFPADRDPDWNPIPYNALIAPDFDVWANVTRRVSLFALDSFMQSPHWRRMAPIETMTYLGQLLGAGWSLADLEDVRAAATHVYEAALGVLGLPDAASAAYQTRSTKARAARRKGPQWPGTARG